MLLKWLRDGVDNETWRMHGGDVTVKVYQKIDKDTILKHINFLNNLKEYFIDAHNRLFVHAGFTHLRGVEFEFFRAMFWWDRTLWETAIATEEGLDLKDLRYPQRLKLYKEIFIGHTSVTRFGQATPMNSINVWNVDTGAAFKGRLTLMDVESKRFWQSDDLPTFYPNEKGRN